MPNFNWTPFWDNQLRELAPKMTSNEAADLLGIHRDTLVCRARLIGRPFPKIKTLSHPTPDEWIQAATTEAAQAGVRVGDVLAGDRRRGPCVARWRAWKRVLDSNPRYSVIGLARTSGFDHSTLISALRRLSKIDGVRQSPRQKPVATIEAAE